MEKKIIITYDMITRSLSVKTDDEISTFEALGMIEGAKALVINEWNEDN